MKLRILAVLIPVCLWPALSPAADDEFLKTKLEEVQKQIEQELLQSANDYFGGGKPTIKLRYLDNKNGNFDDGIAIDYDWKRNWSSDSVPDTHRLSQMEYGKSADFTFRAFNAELYAKGSYARQRVDNNHNLATAGAALTLKASSAPWTRIPEQDAKGIRKCNEELDPTMPKAEYDAAAQHCYDLYAWVAKQNGMAYGYSLDFHYELEGDQRFADTQKAYGMQAAVALAPQPNSPWRNLNIFDYPFRFITRPLFGGSKNYVARLPSLALALQQVDPGNNTQRIAIDPSGDIYDRYRVEVAFSTQVAQINNLPITFQADYRSYHEPNAPAAVEAAGQDIFEYTTAAVYFPAGLFGLGGTPQNNEFFLQYSTGTLPFDVAGKDTVSLGWKTNLDTLLKLLSSD